MLASVVGRAGRERFSFGVGDKREGGANPPRSRHCDRRHSLTYAGEAQWALSLSKAARVHWLYTGKDDQVVLLPSWGAKLSVRRPAWAFSPGTLRARECGAF